MISFKIPYITVLRLVYILADSTCVLFSVLTPKQIIACSEVGVAYKYKKLFKLDAPTSNRRRLYCIKF